MANTTKKVLHKRSVAVENELPKLPTSSQLEFGELAINYADGYETISIKNNNNEIVTFSSDSKKYKANIFKGTCETAAETIAKTVVCPDFTASDLVKGTLIFVTFNATNTGAVGSLTMNVNSTGAKPLKKQYNGGVNNLSTASELLANSTYLFQYNGTSWVNMTLDYNSTGDYQLTYFGKVKADKENISRYTLLMQTPNSTWASVTTNAVTAQTSSATTIGFLPESPILYYTSAVTSGNVGVYNYGYLAYYAVDFRYSSNCTSGSTTVDPMPVGAPVFFVGTIKNGLFYLDETRWWTNELPTTEDGKVYKYVGQAYSTATLSLYTEHPIFEYKNGHIRQYQEDNIPEIITDKEVFSGLTQSGSIVDAYLVKEVIRENELVTSTALNDLNTRANSLTASAQSIDTRVTALENEEVDLSTVASSVTVNGTTYAVSNGGVNIGSYLSASTVYISGITLNGSAVPVTNKVANLGNVVTAITINESAMTPTNGTVNLGNYIPIEKELTISSAFNDLNDRITELEGLVQSLSTQLQSLQTTVNNMNNSGGSAA